VKFKKFITKELDVKSIYHLLISGVSPRPIALVGSMDKKGYSNLAPFSFFNAFGANPPIIGFSPALSGRTGLPKDTLLNIKETREFTVSIVNSSIVEQINLSSCEFDKNIDEFIKTGLTKYKSENIAAYGVQESNFIMECMLYDIIDLGGKPASGNLILGKVVQFHINESILTESNQVDPYKLDPIARNGGSWYTEVKKGLFELKKPKNIGIGFDQLPSYILNSNLTGNQLAQLASVESIPTFKENRYMFNSRKELIELIKKKIDGDNINEAWQLILYLGSLYNEK
jgi:flavin reductase (DIM6/NTAB) family NADH-FMN oxidoreductase RutF